MPQEHQVLRCFSCEVFQVHIVKKDKKWQCKMCGAKQSLKRNYGRGSGKDCRAQVMKLNELRMSKADVLGQVENESFEETLTDELKKPEPNEQKALISKWSEYLDEIEPDTEEEIKVDEKISVGFVERKFKQNRSKRFMNNHPYKNKKSDSKSQVTCKTTNDYDFPTWNEIENYEIRELNIEIKNNYQKQSKQIHNPTSKYAENLIEDEFQNIQNLSSVNKLPDLEIGVPSNQCVTNWCTNWLPSNQKKEDFNIKSKQLVVMKSKYSKYLDEDESEGIQNSSGVTKGENLEICESNIEKKENFEIQSKHFFETHSKYAKFLNKNDSQSNTNLLRVNEKLSIFDSDPVDLDTILDI